MVKMMVDDMRDLLAAHLVIYSLLPYTQTGQNITTFGEGGFLRNTKLSSA